MSDSEQGSSGWGAGAVITAVIVVFLVLAGVAAVVLLKMRASAPPPQPPVALGRAPANPPPPVAPQLMSTPGKPVTVKLTALGDNGTWYTIDEDICEGDAALTGMLQDRIARDKAARKNPADYSYPVVFEVAPGTGIGEAHVAAARTAAEAAGATAVGGRKP
jgi:hypothetical protein